MKKTIFILLLLVISAHYLPNAMLLHSGYCAKEKRYLTTQEKFDIVVTNIINEENRLLPYTVNEFGWKIFPNNERHPEGWRDDPRGTISAFKYSGLEEFYARNPSCCELVESFAGGERLINTVPFWERARGNLNIFVRVFYIYDYDTKHDSLPLYAERYFGLSNCGNLWTAGEVIGLHLPKRFLGH